jgi:hypothetical protein
MFNLSSLKAVILGLSFRDLNTFVCGAFQNDVGREGGAYDNMDAMTAWAEGYTPPVGETSEPPPDSEVGGDLEQQPPTNPEPVKDVHLDIPKDTDFMILTAKVPNNQAEDFQRLMPEWKGVVYACEFMNQREAMNVEEWRTYGTHVWENFFT